MKTKERVVLWMLVFGWLVGCADVEFKAKPEPEAKNNVPVCTNCSSDPTYRRYVHQITVPPANNRLDILFVIDNSPSMATEQNLLSNRFANFISNLSGLDYQIGFVTTDMSGSGAYEGGNLIQIDGEPVGVVKITPSTVNPSQKFRDTVRISRVGHGDERGIYAAIRAIERGGVMRSNADLAVVILSDEDERSAAGNQPGYPMISGDDYAQDLIDTVRNIDSQRRFTVHSIVIQSGDYACLNQQDAQPGASAHFGTVYEEASTLTAGIIGSVCMSDYGSMLSTIGDRINETRNSETLACVPDVTPSEGRNFEIDADPAIINGVTREADKVYFEPPLQSGDTITLTYWCRA